MEKTKDDLIIKDQKCGFIAVIGEPNAGKSTLINRFVGAKVTIVSPKVQTTRRRILGIAITEDTQLIFIDTPGIFNPNKDLEKAMVKEAWNAPADADINLVMFDVTGKNNSIEDTIGIIEKARTENKRAKIALVLNKIDKIGDKSKLLEIADTFNKKVGEKIDNIFMISALDGRGCKELSQYLEDNSPICPWMYPEDQITDLPQRQLAAEITREYVFKFLHQELPYSITVETDKWETLRDKSVKIYQTIYTNRTAHRRMILGEKGEMIKRISMSSRKELSDIFAQKIHLFLNVKVDKNWLKKPQHYKEMGLEFEHKK